MENQQNLLLAIVLSVGVLLAWQYFFIAPRMEAERQAQEIVAQRQQTETVQPQPSTPSQSDGGVPAPAPSSAVAPGDIPGSSTIAQAAGAVDITAEIAAGQRVKIDTASLSGSFNLQGGRIDDLRLKRYKKTIDPGSETIVLLAPSESEHGFLAEMGWVGDQRLGELPGPNTVWQTNANRVLSETNPLELTWSNANGLTFQRTVAIDEHYMFTVTDRITNSSDAATSLSPYGRIIRYGTPDTSNIFVLHEGLIAVLGEEGLHEVDYDDLEDDLKYEYGEVSRGWLGITDKYWAAVLVPDNAFTSRFSYFTNGEPRFQSDYLAAALEIPAGGSASYRARLFAGAKEVSIIDRYEQEGGVDKFELMIDWGWFYFITKPLFIAIDWIYKLVGNFGVAILLITVAIKALFFPLANLSYASMARMKLVQPEMTKIRERYADDRTKQQQEMMALYKTKKINPAAGCWPIMIQIPVFFALYKVLFVTIEMRHAPFFGWIQDLAAPDPTSVFNLFGLLPFAVPAFLMIGIWPLLMGITMFIQMRMNPAPPDPTQAMIFNWMPIIFTFLLATFPAGLVIYWAWNNFLSIMQQGVIMRRHGAKIELWNNISGMLSKFKAPAE